MIVLTAGSGRLCALMEAGTAQPTPCCVNRKVGEDHPAATEPRGSKALTSRSLWSNPGLGQDAGVAD